MAVYFREFTDVSKYYVIRIKALASDEKYSAKISLEIANPKNPTDIRSFRSDSRVDIEDFICSLISAYGYLLANNKFFNDVDGSRMPEDKLTLAIEDRFSELKKKFRVALADGIRKFFEEKL